MIVCKVLTDYCDIIKELIRDSEEVTMALLRDYQRFIKNYYGIAKRLLENY